MCGRARESDGYEWRYGHDGGLWWWWRWAWNDESIHGWLWPASSWFTSSNAILLVVGFILYSCLLKSLSKKQRVNLKASYQRLQLCLQPTYTGKKSDMLHT